MSHPGPATAPPQFPPVRVMWPRAAATSINAMSAHPAGHDGKRQPDKLTKVILMASAALVTLLVTLVAGIAIGNVARKKLDRLSHGYQLM